MRQRLSNATVGSALWIAGVVAVLIRAAALWMDRHSLMFETGGLDSAEYLVMAKGLWSGEWPGSRPFFWAPGYPFLLGVLSAISSATWWFKLVQILIGAATTVLIGRLALLLFARPSIALLAAGMAALYGPLVYYDLQISPATLDTFLIVLLLVVAVDPRFRARGLLWSISLGCVAAASAVTRGAVLLAVPLVLAWLWNFEAIGASRRTRLVRCAGLALPIVTVLAALALHNWRHDSPTGHPTPARDAKARAIVPVSSNLGINFLLGNVPDLYDANRAEDARCFVSYKGAVSEPMRHGYVSASSSSRYLFWKALRWMSQHPVEWLRLLVRKVSELGHGQEISRDTSIYAARLDNPILAALIWNAGIAFPSGLLIPLALVGIGRAILRKRGHPIVWILLVSQAMFVLAFFVTTRYRLPLCTILIPFAAYAVVEVNDSLRSAALKPTGATLLALVALVLMCNRGLHAHPDKHLVFEHIYAGLVFNWRGETDRAAEQWRIALHLDPIAPTAHFNLAGLLLKKGDVAAASSHYEAGLRQAPTAYLAYEEYAQLLLRTQKPELALDQFLYALALAPSLSLRRTVCDLGPQVDRYLPLRCP